MMSSHNLWVSLKQLVIRGAVPTDTPTITKAAPTSDPVSDKKSNDDSTDFLVLNLNFEFPKKLPENQQKSFTCFLKLPLELQRQIWREAARLQRFVIISDSEIVKKIAGSSCIIQISKNPQPAVLQACQESRAECMQFFKPRFGGAYQIGSKPGLLVQVSPVYLNPSSDIVYLSARNQSQFHNGWLYDRDSESLKSIETVALEWDDIRRLGTFQAANWLTGLLVHQHVKTLILILKYQKAETAQAGLDVELLPVSTDAGRKAATAATHFLSTAFDHFHENLAWIAKARYLLKPHPKVRPFGSGSRALGNHNEFWVNSHVADLEVEENPSQEALQKYADRGDWLRSTTNQDHGVCEGRDQKTRILIHISN